MAEIVGRHKEGNRTIEGRLLQKTMLVRGDNNREVWDYVGNRMAVAVTEPVPFHIEIVPPKVPLVQNGNMELKVTATRDGAFKGAISLRMLYNPSGVSSPDSVTIPEGQNQALVPLTADGGATLRTWKIALLGESSTGDGPLVVSSQLADLEVAEPRLRFQFQPAAVEQGQKTSIVLKVEKTRKLESPATIELLGLPNEVTSEPRQIDDAAGEVIFPITTTSHSPPGLHKTIFCRAVVKSQGEPITHVVGGGELRIQPPLPPKTMVAAKPEPEARAATQSPRQAARCQATQPPRAIAIGKERGNEAMTEENTKLEIQNPKQAQNPNQKCHNTSGRRVYVIGISYFIFVSYFVFRISYFGRLSVPRPRCHVLPGRNGPIGSLSARYPASHRAGPATDRGRCQPTWWRDRRRYRKGKDYRSRRPHRPHGKWHNPSHCQWPDHTAGSV